MKTKKSRLRSVSGFTLAELLMVVIILLLASSIATVGISSAANAYQKVVDSANAQLLLSTTVSSLRRALAMASEVKEDGEKLVYTSGETGLAITLVSAGDGIRQQWTNTKGESEDHLLVTEKAATKGMISSFSGITFSDGVFTVSGLKIVKNGHEYAGLKAPIMIRAVTLDAAPTPTAGP